MRIFQKPLKDIKPEIQESQGTSRMRSANRTIIRTLIVKQLQIKDKGKFLNGLREKRCITFQGWMTRTTANFSIEGMEKGRQ